MTGVLIINKPKGITSHDVVSRVRRILHTRKVGHAGTLDPLATGVLVVLVGKATKLSDMLLCESKHYEAEFRLGIETDTYDITGNIVSEKEYDIDKTAVREALKTFEGVQHQLPPMYSAIKKDGKKLYEYARRGETVDIKPRRITIDSISLIGENTLDIVCSKGTYIRSLVHDMGQKLGCGACLTELKRISSGRFCIENSCTLEQLEQDGFDKHALSIDDVLAVPEVFVCGETERKMKNGNSITLKKCDEGFVKVKDTNESIICYAYSKKNEDAFRVKPEIMLYEE